MEAPQSNTQLVRAEPTLLGIPPEIRVKIYKFLFVDIKVQKLRHIEDGFATVKCVFNPAHPLAMLRVNQQLNREAEQYALSCPVTLHLAPDITDCLPTTLPKNIRNRVQCIKDDSPTTFAATTVLNVICRDYVTYYPNLKSEEFACQREGGTKYRMARSQEKITQLLDSGTKECDYDQDILKDLSQGLDYAEPMHPLIELMRRTDITLKLPCVFSRGRSRLTSLASAMLIWDKNGVKVTQLEDLRHSNQVLGGPLDRYLENTSLRVVRWGIIYPNTAAYTASRESGPRRQIVFPTRGAASGRGILATRAKAIRRGDMFRRRGHDGPRDV